MKCGKNKKSLGCDRVNVNFMKYAPAALHYRFLGLLNICWRTAYILEE
jgi:hypothetical protein